MIRLGISVEGKTERLFVNKVLQPHLQACGVDVAGVDIGGNVGLDKVRRVLPALLGDFGVVTTMYDYYRFKGRDGRNVVQLEEAIGELVRADRRERLIPYVQLHEFEALLFASPKTTKDILMGTVKNQTEMESVVKKAGGPEDINDGWDTKPSRRIEVMFPSYDKVLHAPDVVAKAGLPAIRAQCPRFDAWISKLESLGAQP